MNKVMALQLDYIGRCKPRAKGPSALGWYENRWRVVLPSDVLFGWFGVTSANQTLYELLSVKPSAPQGAIKDAWKSAMKLWHPDHNKEPEALERSQDINEAYTILKDPNKRARYDAGLKLAGNNDSTQELLEGYGWRAPKTNGLIVANVKYGKWIVVESIISWSDIINDRKETMVSSWVYGDDEPIRQWV